MIILINVGENPKIKKNQLNSQNLLQKNTLRHDSQTIEHTIHNLLVDADKYNTASNNKNLLKDI